MTTTSRAMMVLRFPTTRWNPAFSTFSDMSNQDVVVFSSGSARKAKIRTTSSAAKKALSFHLTDKAGYAPIIHSRAEISKRGFVGGLPRRCAVCGSTVNTNGTPMRKRSKSSSQCIVCNLCFCRVRMRIVTGRESHIGTNGMRGAELGFEHACPSSLLA